MHMREVKKVVSLTKSEYHIVIDLLTEKHNNLLNQQEPTADIDNVLSTFMDAPTKSMKVKDYEAR